MCIYAYYSLVYEKYSFLNLNLKNYNYFCGSTIALNVRLKIKRTFFESGQCFSKESFCDVRYLLVLSPPCTRCFIIIDVN